MVKETKGAGFGIVVFALSLAQFIMTVDTTIMNVSVPTLVNDLSTTVGAVQSAITLYALIMASFMLIGSKLGELYGRRKMFQLGLVIYAIGSGITAIAPNIGVLIFGWSLLEGVGASLMMPAMMSLISVNFKGKKRVSALGIVAGVAGAAAALGPIIGGALATYASWRYAFVGEVVIALVTLTMSKAIADTSVKSKEKLDYKGSIMAATGLGIFVYGILQASEYGWIRATKPFEIGDMSLELLGLSIVPFISGLGVFILWRFFKLQSRLADQKKPYLLDISLLRSIRLRSGLSVVLIIQLVMGGTLFVMPLFLQLVLGYSAMRSGLALLPISIALIGMSAFGQKLFAGKTAIYAVRFGQSTLIAGLVWLITVIDNDTNVSDLVIPFLLIGAGIGSVIPFIQAIVLGSVRENNSTQAAGLNYTYQQLGMSLGTAVIGSILLFSLGNGIIGGLGDSSVFGDQFVQQNSVAITNNVEFIDNEQLQSRLDGSDLSEEQKATLFEVNSDARLRALKVSIGAAAIFAVLSMSASGKVKDAL